MKKRQMKAKVKKLWVNALRSGEYKQTVDSLRNGNSFCCLGVLCNLHAQAHPAIAALETDPDYYLGMSATLPKKVARWAGLSTDNSDTVTIDGLDRALAIHNDEGQTFKQIADAIEEQL